MSKLHKITTGDDTLAVTTDSAEADATADTYRRRGYVDVNVSTSDADEEG